MSPDHDPTALELLREACRVAGVPESRVLMSPVPTLSSTLGGSAVLTVALHLTAQETADLLRLVTDRPEPTIPTQDHHRPGD